MQVPLFKCPHCEQQMSKQLPPNFTVIPAPVEAGGAVVVLSCFSMQCGKVVGVYSTGNLSST
jgi:hypothetical protein